MTRQPKENGEHPDEAGDQSGQGGPDSGGQSGDTQGVSQAVEAAEESVEELTAAGQDYEAQILKGVEDATDHRGQPVPNHGGQKRRDHAPPPRRQGERVMTCKAILKLADDFGDNECTITCDLEEGHEGKHEGRFWESSSTESAHTGEARNVSISWDGDSGHGW